MSTPYKSHVFIFTWEQIQQLFAACDVTTAQGQRDHTMVLILLHTGMRVSELCQLRIQDIQGSLIHIIGKAHISRDFRVTNDVSQQLAAYLNGYRRAVDSNVSSAFIDDEGQPFTPDAVSRWFSALKGRAGIEGNGLSLHAFRNTCASHLFHSHTSS
ncbi:hypothetical protein KDA_18770 [Dictyobacter alpinus]|uniref:Tyr recombinase domain-containing protein n=1 Tax=Dictyobacter alpinus TaxID=2014873 RepID=A0A402B4W4_9CHLR|nr:tyrosine-type recombinase/integrase [Dictyobacter alpinus]GCE26393.1 hypothetical protein KDA_18770 [Dictyobacter alpinus]